MSDRQIYCCGGQCGTAMVARKPRAVVVGNSLFAANAADQFRKLSWDVCTIVNADDLARAVLAKKPNAVVLPIETGAESGHLIAAKLRKVKPKLRVVLVGAERTLEAERFARFVGATFAAEGDGAGRVVAGIAG
jgi:hypothetical protein